LQIQLSNMVCLEIVVISSLQKEIDESDARTRKLFEKQRYFMSLYPSYPSLGRTKLENVCDKYGQPLWEIRLDIKRRIVFVERDGRAIWLKIVDHDEIQRKGIIHAEGEY
jgi:hypothetical protein